ncbi:DegT/DnrJ/EryC1/StrS family aminotransferase [Chitinivorax sp. B]|uniref:DegT/DnrJ/EryC1/StrS family aminotransferase n=1 Tax=Chitinivorax sp. B TaxID=2502235 RepID=UPI0010F7FFBF|nr:DegT/DnrJ/EryC1/StrS family aminotransferase [Chitinivorax sp. B]
MTALAGQQVEFIRLDPFRDYPAPRLPVLPILDSADFGQSGGEASPFLSNRALFLNAGRSALQSIASHLPNAGDVLIPAYHCPTMVTPIYAAGRQVRFYKVDALLQPDLTDIETQLASGNVAAVLVPHFFGFPQPQLHAIAERTHQAQAWLIEDCAHAFFGQWNGTALGLTGDYAIASTRKFFPGRDGGVLLINTGPAFNVTLPHPRWHEELRSVYDLLQQSVESGRINWLRWAIRPRTDQASPGVYLPMQSLPPQTIQINPKAGMPVRHGLRSSRWIMHHQQCDHIVQRRRQLYIRWLERTSKLTAARPLFDMLPDLVVPYMFPLLLAEPERHFAPLKQARLPIWRWDELASSTCQISQHYGIALLQLPCHQSITDADLDWMADQLCHVLKSPKGTPQ